jgi:hypothetical protein
MPNLLYLWIFKNLIVEAPQVISSIKKKTKKKNKAMLESTTKSSLKSSASLKNSQKSTGLFIKAFQADSPLKITKSSLKKAKKIIESIASPSVTLPNENTTIVEGCQQGDSKWQFSCFKNLYIEIEWIS